MSDARKSRDIGLLWGGVCASVLWLLVCLAVHYHGYTSGKLSVWADAKEHGVAEVVKDGDQATGVRWLTESPADDEDAP